MLRRLSLFASLLLVAGASAAEDAPVATVAKVDVKTSEQTTAAAAAKSKVAKAGADDKTLSGMSILGNQEAPKALVIVPWKSSRLGDEIGLSKTLDDGRRPVDKDVFLRELAYYEIRASSK
jgi:hypothetical protein